MPTSATSPIGASVLHPSDAGYVLILAWDAFRADTVRRCANAACPQLKNQVFHGAEVALAELRRRPARLGVISIGMGGAAEADLLARADEERLLARALLIVEQCDHRSLALARLELVHGVFDSGGEPPPMLTRAIRDVAAGRRYYSATLARAIACSGDVLVDRPNGTQAEPNGHGAPNGHHADLFRPEQWEAVAGRLHLSRRELEIVRRLFANRGESAIAAELGVAPRTIHTHLERLHCKLDVHYRAELILRIVRELLARPDASVSAR